ncbi:AAA family ATPase [Candidatus Magnetaquicoccus inordinatus]|uniref:AAA family ATPase n=1 Tax=Candidatus Magnetaquicoccus inordinatus TaxID=2496818 RepID=UPI00102AE0B5|nr:ATP-binding protein [Candidatus Magnetaquicoccus inordinatus]
MIKRIIIRNYRSIKEIDLELGQFHLLVGPNGSGKSTFLDALEFVRDFFEIGLRKAVEKRTGTVLDDLTFLRRGGNIEFSLVIDSQFYFENLEGKEDIKFSVFICNDTEKGVYSNYFVNIPAGMGEDGKNFLSYIFCYLQLDSSAMRWPCSALAGTVLERNGSNLARVVGRLRGDNQRSPNKRTRFKQTPIIKEWVHHLQYALPGLAAIGWDRREADNAEYLILKYEDGLECPSWLLSDGTLRMLALTLLAFLPPSAAIYMIEEPENGVHPRALEIIVRALSTVPQAQVFLSTHSPLVVQHVDPAQLLCFSSGPEGTQVIPGSQHPILQQWDGTPDLATIFASGILG